MTNIYKTSFPSVWWAIKADMVYKWDSSSRSWVSLPILSRPSGVAAVKRHATLVAKVKEFKQ